LNEIGDRIGEKPDDDSGITVSPRMDVNRSINTEGTLIEENIMK
jgi:hypothetical protein